MNLPPAYIDCISQTGNGPITAATNRMDIDIQDAVAGATSPVHGGDAIFNGLQQKIPPLSFAVGMKDCSKNRRRLIHAWPLA